MNDNIKRTKNINLLSIVSLMLLIIVIILGGTYAAFVVSKQDSSTITGAANCYKVKYTKGQDINGALEADTNFTSGWSTDIVMYAESGCEDLTATLYLTTNPDTTMDLSDKALKYTVVLNNSIVSEGSVDGTANQVIYNNFKLNTTQTTYRVYIWLDSVLEDLTNFDSEAYSGFIHADVTATSDMSFSSPLYSQIDFIESTGTQYIDTGLIINKSDSYEYIIDANFSNATWGGANGYLQFNSQISQNKRTTFRVVYNGSNHVEDIYVNGTLNSSQDWTDQYNGTNVKIGIFRLGNANNEWWTGGDNQKGKVYSVKIYKNGTLVRDYISVYRKSDKEIGLYDKVEGKFYENAGSGEFIGYQRIEYIEATGTQYINTGVIGKARWEFDIQFTDLKTRQLMGYGGSGAEYWGVQDDGNYGLAVWSYMNKQAGNRDKVIHNYGENNEYYLDVNGTRMGIGVTDVTSLEYVLFGLGAGSFPCKAKLYGLKTIQNGVVIRDFVPVYRLNDGVIGLYDQVEGKLYTNNGSGTLAGYQRVEYIESNGTQFINTGVNWDTNDMEIEGTFSYNVFMGHSTILGLQGNNGDFLLREESGVLVTWVGLNNKQELTPISLGQKIDFNIMLSSSGTFTYNVNLDAGTPITGSRPHTNTYTNTPIYIFDSYYDVTGGVGSQAAATIACKAKLYRMKLSKNGILIRDFIPVYRINDGVIGLYDQVGGKFYANGGTGSFTKGNDVAW